MEPSHLKESVVSGAGGGDGSPRRPERWTVHKFGGTSVASPENMLLVARIVIAEQQKETLSIGPHHVFVVVSAMGGVTNSLLELIRQAASRDPLWNINLDRLLQRHVLALRHLRDSLPANGIDNTYFIKVFSEFEQLFQSNGKDLRDLLHAISLTRHCAKVMKDIVACYGELWSYRLVHLAFVVEIARSHVPLQATAPNQTNTDGAVAVETAPAAPAGQNPKGLQECKYGQHCYRKNVEHLAAFYHPATRLGLAAISLASGVEINFAQQLGHVDSREVIVVQESDIGPIVEWKQTKKNIAGWLEGQPSLAVPGSSSVYVAPGFVCADNQGLPATLARNGSDFSATIYAALLRAEFAVIWTDVDGIYSADPRKVPGAVLLDEMTFQEALELSYFGAKVLHHQSIAPCMSLGIPIWIRNTFNTNAAGTKITSSSGTHPPVLSCIVKGISLIEDIALVDVEGTGMCGVPGIAERMFAALKASGVSVVLITQASSEHSICCAVPTAQSATAQKAIEEAFLLERTSNFIQTVEIVQPCAILAVVGDNMIHAKGVAAKIFSAIAKVGVNILAIAQGSSERNISIVVKNSDGQKAVAAVHSAFYVTHAPLQAVRRHKVKVGLLGVGLVGLEVVNQLRSQIPKFRAKFNCDLHISALARSKTMALLSGDADISTSEHRVDSHYIETLLEMEFNMAAFLSHLRNQTSDNPSEEEFTTSVVVDCTASDVIAQQYDAFLNRGIHVVAANKRCVAGDITYYSQLQDILKEKKGSVELLYESTVGAGLPVVKTLRELIDSGDQVFQINGILSGTLAWLFNEFRASGDRRPFSELVLAAKAKGFTEPDPREDLSGLDFARKLVILARLSGMSRISLSDVEIESLVPNGLETCSVCHFLAQLPLFDDSMQQRRQEAAKVGCTLIYSGVIDLKENKVSAKIRQVPLTDPLATLSGAENVVSFVTERWASPIIIRGPGAGPAVTAAGVLGDILTLIRRAIL